MKRKIKWNNKKAIPNVNVNSQSKNLRASLHIQKITEQF